MKYTEHSLKILFLEEAAEIIKSGDSIWVGGALSIPSPFLDKLAERHKELHDVTIVGDSFIKSCKLLIDPKYRTSFNIVSLYESLPFNYLYKEPSNIDYVKKPSGPYPKTIYEKYKINLMVFEVCPPDISENCNLGFTGGAITPYLTKCAGIKIAIINELLRASSDDGEFTSIPLSYFDYVCMCNH